MHTVYYSELENLQGQAFDVRVRDLYEEHGPLRLVTTYVNTPKHRMERFHQVDLVGINQEVIRTLKMRVPRQHSGKQLFNNPEGHRGSATVSIPMHELYNLIKTRLGWLEQALENGNSFDPDALCQQICVEVEKQQGTFPNLREDAIQEIKTLVGE